MLTCLQTPNLTHILTGHVEKDHSIWDYFAALATINTTPFEHCSHIERAIKIKWINIPDENSAGK